jgi:SagB-type dehydrogenase family enzyme
MDDHVAQRIDRVRTIHRALIDQGPAPMGEDCLTDVSGGSSVLRTPSAAPTTPLGQALHERRSRYDFAPLGHPDLSSLLRWALGPGRIVTASDGSAHVLNLHPSAGGLPSITAYVVVLQHVDDIPAGVHVFDRAEHRLVSRRRGDARQALASSLVQPEFAEQAPAVIVLVGELQAVLGKYSHRHYRTLHIDAGIAAAHLYLVATALDLACCAISGFYDDNLGEVLSLNGNQIPLLALAVGARRQLGEQR